MNDKMARILSAAQDIYPHRLEAAFPNLVEKIATLWNDPAMESCFTDLMLDQRGNRQGFSPEILLEIFALRNYFHSLQPAPARTSNTWTDLVEIDRARKDVL